jgi:hypothetical protein
MYLLNSFNVIRYLLRSGFAEVPGGGEWCVTVGTNNRTSATFLAELRAGDGPETRRCWFLKQDQLPFGPDDGMATEGQTYRLLAGEDRLRPYLALSPTGVPYYYDATNRILVLDGLQGFSPVPERLHEPQTGVDLRTGGFAAAVATMMATFHGCLERTRLTQAIPPTGTAFARNVPALLRNGAVAVRVLDEYAPTRRLMRSLTAMLLDPAVLPLLERLHQNWAFSHLVHGDAAFRNVLYRVPTGTDAFELRWVDWETAGWGDPRWDFALFFLDVLRAYFAGYVNKATFRCNGQEFWRNYFKGQSDKPAFDEWWAPVLRLAVLKGIAHLMHTALNGPQSAHPTSEADLLKSVARMQQLFIKPFCVFP